ncbi:MAG: hypothetical protein ACI4IR_02715 [Eubacterium sp.]
MNRKEFKQAMSGVQSSEQTIERIMDMTNKETKKKIKFAPALALVVCLAILVTGIFGGSAITAKTNPVANTSDTSQVAPSANNFFTITAYAKDNNSEKKIDLSENKIAKTDVKIELIKGESGEYDTVTTETQSAFCVEGKDIKTVTYSAEKGTFDYQSLYGNDFNLKENEVEYDASKPYTTKVTIDNLGENEAIELFYSPEEAISILLKSKNPNYDYTTLPSDTLTISVTFNDGSTAEKQIKTSFDKDGYMQMEYVK